MLVSRKGHVYEGEELEKQIEIRKKITLAYERAPRWGRKRKFDYNKIRELKAQGKTRTQIMREVGCSQCVITTAMQIGLKNG